MYDNPWHREIGTLVAAGDIVEAQRLIIEWNKMSDDERAAFNAMLDASSIRRRQRAWSNLVEELCKLEAVIEDDRVLRVVWRVLRWTNRWRARRRL